MAKRKRERYPYNRFGNPEWLKQTYPHLSDEEVGKIVRMRGGLLTKPQKERYLNLWALGYSTPDICDKMRISRSYPTITKMVDKEFAEQVRRIQAGRKRQVESHLFRYACGKLRQVKLIQVCKLDHEGNPLFDETGKQVFYTQRREITTLAPQPALVQFFLKAQWPEVYGETTSDQGHLLTPEEMAAKLEEAAKDLDAYTLKLPQNKAL